MIYFDSFEVKHIPKEIKSFTGIRISQQIFLKYKHLIQNGLDTFVLDLLILHLRVTIYLCLYIFITKRITRSENIV